MLNLHTATYVELKWVLYFGIVSVPVPVPYNFYLIRPSESFQFPSTRRSPCNGLFTLPDMDSCNNSNSDSKPDGYIVLYRTCSLAQSQIWIHIWTRISQSPLYRFLGQISIPGLGSESVSSNINKA